MSHDYHGLKPGDRIKIAGVRFGKQFPIGFTTRCKPGHETELVITDQSNGAMGVKASSVRPAISAARQYGPPQRKKWKRGE